ncbi:hypothetical protein [Fibrisoma montanum]|uniref:hypothetical protein n=1 Tax=Fibrisoma montanum TaxID=2305895 RepID=UPI0011C21961|nr:hypothetical protein [Fibrisoma montanum]
MGSTGTGNFSDYPGSSSSDGKTGGKSGQDLCSQAFSTALEDIERSDYYLRHQKLPSAGTEVYVQKQKRLVVTTKDNVVIGHLPTKYNYLAGCMEGGLNFQGLVTNAASSPISKIIVDIAPA